MRIFFLSLLAVGLFTACNPDTAGVGSERPSAVVAPAAAPTSLSANHPSAIGAPAQAAAPAQEQDNASKMEPGDDAEVGDEAAAKRMGPGRNRPLVGTTPQAAANNGTSAKAKQQPTKPTEMSLGKSVGNIMAPIVFKVRKTPCYGNCKQYAIRLHDTGELVLEGKKNLRQLGLFTRQMMGFKYQDLVQQFIDLKPTELAKLYPENEEVAADLPATILTFNDVAGEEHEVKVYYDAPEPLAEFLAQVERLAETGTWEKAVE